MKAWMTKALGLLKASLEPPKHELNELDWKAELSPDKKRLTAGKAGLRVNGGKKDPHPLPVPGLGMNWCPRSAVTISNLFGWVSELIHLPDFDRG